MSAGDSAITFAKNLSLVMVLLLHRDSTASHRLLTHSESDIFFLYTKQMSKFNTRISSFTSLVVH